jgi:acetyl-CoA synthetase
MDPARQHIDHPEGAPQPAASPFEAFRQARDQLLETRDDLDAARARFRWPRLEHFNWALDWFDAVAADNERAAVRIIDARTGERRELSYAQLSRRSNRVANWLRRHGLERGGRLLLMLDNDFPVWEAILAAMKLGAVVIPTYTSVSGRDLADRIERGGVTHVLTDAGLTHRFAELPAGITRMSTGAAPTGWLAYAEAGAESAAFEPGFRTRADELLFIYFTSGTTSRPKMVGHTHASYPVGHLTGMYWNALRPGDVHANVSAPGWAKHAWSSFFAPFNAEATVLSITAPPGQADAFIDALRAEQVTSLCAPPTVWRMLVQARLGERPARLRDATSVGEPLNPEVIARVEQAWGLTVRDGYGQTEVTAMIGNTVGAAIKPGSVGRVLPGYSVVLRDPETGQPAREGEICVDLSDRPVPMMVGYLDDEEKTEQVFADGFYHTGDIAIQDADGYLTYVGRRDDVFKSFDHRISPFELESALLEHPHVAEAAVVPIPHAVGAYVPKAFVRLVAGVAPSREVAHSIVESSAQRLAPHQRLAAIEFGELPKTTSGKIRRAELRAGEQQRAGTGGAGSAGIAAWSAQELLGGVARSAPGL